MNRWVLLFILMIVANSCRFTKGDQYYSSSPGDSLLYLIAAKGKGEHLSEKASELKYIHESKGNECKIRYVSDSASMKEQKSVLLVNTRLPKIKEDMLTKGYFGTFTSRQSVSYLLVSYDDFDQFFSTDKPSL